MFTVSYLPSNYNYEPLELVKRHILHTTKKDDLILDCFSRKWNNLCSG